jgi:Na+-driven multidrug efflux pump
LRTGWNVAGAAAATAISQACACGLLLVELNGKRGNRAPSTIEAPSAKEGNLLGTSLALLLRSTCQLGTWVFVASQVSRRLGARAIAAHGVVLKVWLLFVLAAEAPAVAGQIISAGYLATGRRVRARAEIQFRSAFTPSTRRLLDGVAHATLCLISQARAARVVKRLGKATVTIGLITAAALAAAAGPISYAFFPTDTAAAKSTKTIFRWAALSVPLVWPNALCEAVLLGAGRYRYLAGATLVNALVASFATVALLSARPLVTSAWACLCGFFVLRFAVSAGGAARELLPANRAGGLRYRSSSSR